jgi:hypothetical protein
MRRSHVGLHRRDIIHREPRLTVDQIGDALGAKRRRKIGADEGQRKRNTC